MKTSNARVRQTPLDILVAVVALAFAAAVSAFALRNNDIWWMMATGRRILETKAFIYTDPFSFALDGHPWSPQGYLSAIIFYLVYSGAGAVGLIVLRAALVVATVAVSLRTLTRAGVSWAMSGAMVILVVLIAQTRFIVRAHLFEYLFIAVTMGFLLTAHERRGRSFFVLPAVVQVLWTNMHASFLLGPAFIGLFFAGEWIGEKAGTALRPLYRHDWRRVAILMGIVVAACFVNPNPRMFLFQPFSGEQRDLISHFTLEWKSPFDPAIAAGNFHPYYEILLGVVVLAVLASLRRLPPAAVLPIVLTAYLSLKSHRFRVEFALVALPLVCVMVRDAPVTAWLAARVGRDRLRGWARAVLAAAAVVLVAFTARGRLEVGRGAVAARYPDRAFDFVVENGIAQRPFSTIGFGSYMDWDGYGKRKTFIDGRNYDPTLYRDFLGAQASRAGLDHAIGKYRLDAFILPAVETSDAGMTRIHRELASMGGWSLVHMDDIASVYVSNAAADTAWMDAHAYRFYHPLTLTADLLHSPRAQAAVDELERAVKESPEYTTLWLDLGMVQTSLGNYERAVAVLERATAQQPDNAMAWNRLGTAALTGQQYERAIDAFTRLAEVVPGDPRPYLMLGTACLRAARAPEAILAFQRAVEIEPKNLQARSGLFQIHANARDWDRALAVAEETARLVPESYDGSYWAAQTLAALGRTGDAIARANAALRVDPRAAGVHMFLAEQYAAAGDYRRALERVHSVLELEPDNKNALDLQGRLEEAQDR